MRRRFGWLGVGALLVATMLLAISAIVLNFGLRNLQSNRELVTRTSAIEREAAELVASLRAAETGQRGFLLTGQRRYLTPYERARTAIPRNYGELGTLVQDRTQVRRLRLLKPLITEKLEELAYTIALRKQSFGAALQVVETDRGQALTEQIDAILRSFSETERQLLNTRVAAEERETRRITIAASAIALLALFSALIGLAFIFQQRAAEALARVNAELEQRVQERTAGLAAANRELDAFAYTISHDLRAPLRAMHGYSDALLEDYGETLPPEGRGFVRSISAAALRMNALIEDILTYARFSREKVSLRPQSLDSIAANARRAALEAAEGAGDIIIEPALGVACAHGPMLQQMIFNLLSNALKFVPPGQKAVVRVGSERHGGRIRLNVDDNGIGVAADHREQIFSPFTRLHGVESYPGTGIGLAIVRRGAERMGGLSGVEPAPGGGSRFWIELAAATLES